MEKQKKGMGLVHWEMEMDASRKSKQKQKGGHWSFHRICKGKKEREREWEQWQYTQTATHPTVATKKSKGRKNKQYIVYGLRTFNYDSQNGKTITEQIQHSKFVNNKNKQSHTTPNASQRLATPQQKG